MRCVIIVQISNGGVAILQSFIVSRCYRKLRVKFRTYERLFGTRLDERISQWNDGTQELTGAIEWIDVPEGFSRLVPTGMEINSRTLHRGGRTLVQGGFR